MARIGDFQGIAQQSGRVVVDDRGAVKTSNWRGKIAAQLKGDYRAQNTRAKKTLVLAIKNAYGNQAAAAAELKLNMTNGRPLQARYVRAALEDCVVIRRQPAPLQKGDVSLLLERAGVKGARGLNLRPEMLTQLSADVRALKSDSEMLDRLVLSSEPQLRGLVASALGLTDPNASEVTSAVQAIRSGLPNRFNGDKEIIVDGKTYKNPLVLASGANGVATRYAADDKSTIVVKTLKTGGMLDEDDLLAAVRQEVNVHRYAMQGSEPGSEHVAPLLAPVLAPNGLPAIVLKDCRFGDAKHFFKADGSVHKAVQSGVISAKAGKLAKARLAADIVKGMQYLQQSRNMMHLDMKPANLFIDRQGVAQIGDFGEGETRMSALTEFAKGTPVYQAPEYGAENKNANLKVDTYSVGVMMLELFTGQQAFYDTDKTSPWEATSAKEEWFKMHTGLAKGKYATGDADLDALINGLTHKDPQQRMTFEDALKSPVFAGVFDADGADRPEPRALVEMLATVHTFEQERPKASAPLQSRIDSMLTKLNTDLTSASNALG